MQVRYRVEEVLLRPHLKKCVTMSCEKVKKFTKGKEIVGENERARIGDKVSNGAEVPLAVPSHVELLDFRACSLDLTRQLPLPWLTPVSKPIPLLTFPV